MFRHVCDESAEKGRRPRRRVADAGEDEEPGDGAPARDGRGFRTCIRRCTPAECPSLGPVPWNSLSHQVQELCVDDERLRRHDLTDAGVGSGHVRTPRRWAARAAGSRRRSTWPPTEHSCGCIWRCGCWPKGCPSRPSATAADGQQPAHSSTSSAVLSATRPAAVPGCPIRPDSGRPHNARAILASFPIDEVRLPEAAQRLPGARSVYDTATPQRAGGRCHSGGGTRH